MVKLPRFLAAGLALLALSACAEGPSQAVPQLNPGPRPLDLTNMLHARETFYGTVTIQPADEGASIIVALDGDARPGQEDDVVDQVFVMMRYPASGRIQPFRIDGARLEFRGRGVLIEAPERAGSWGFFIRDSAGQEVAAELARERGRTPAQTWQVFGYRDVPFSGR